jgi:hypothetical protein
LKAYLALLALACLLLLTQKAAADPLINPLTKERIGNYDFQMTTQPRPPVAGAPTQIMLRISGVNGDDLVDVPIVIRIEKDGQELSRAGPIVIPYGHYAYDYNFTTPGRYTLYVDLQDNAYSGKTLTFTFLFNVAGPYDNIYVIASGAGAAGAGAASAVVIIRRRRARV